MKTRKAEKVFTCPETDDLTGNCHLCGADLSGHDSDYRCLDTNPPHTPGPWEVTHTLGGTLAITRPHKMPGIAFDVICRMEEHDGIDDEANAAFIVRAVNAHADLLEALKQIINCSPKNEIYEIAWQAIAKAEGK